MIDRLYIFSFILLLFFPFLLFISDDNPKISDVEMRILGKKQYKNDGLRLFPDYSTKFNDLYGFREFYIFLNNSIKYFLFNDSSNKNVILGLDGWLYWNFLNDKVIEDLKGDNQFNALELQGWINPIMEKTQLLTSMDIDYVFLVAPNKHTIYPEFIPDYLHPLKGPTRFDQIVEVLRKDYVLNLLDLRTTLNFRKKNARLFDKTDTHWNSVGAFYASNSLFRFLKHKHFDSLDIPILQLHSTTSKLTSGGNLSRLLYLQDYINELALKPEIGNLSSFTRENFLINNRIEILRTYNADKKFKILVFHDSMFDRMIDYMSHYFQEVYYIKSSFDYDLFFEVSNLFNPDIVIEEIGERALSYSPTISRSRIDTIFTHNENKYYEIIYSDFNELLSHRGKDGVFLYSTGDDPFVYIKNIPFNFNNSFCEISFKLISQYNTKCQLFYLTDANNNFNETDSICFDLLKGNNELKFTIPIVQGVNMLRFDPGRVRGAYFVQEICLKD
jgi:alginate O-acetyltransferase complex protein AlgJ